MSNWRSVIGYEGMYEISENGDVRSLDRIISSGARRKGRVLKFTGKKARYRQVGLSKNNRVKVCDVHRLVAQSFIGPCPVGKQVRHKNGLSKDNRKVNLGYATPKENTLDKFQHGTMLSGERHPNARMREGDVHRIRDLLCCGEMQKAIVAHLQLTKAQVNHVASGTRWKI